MKNFTQCIWNLISTYLRQVKKKIKIIISERLLKLTLLKRDDVLIGDKNCRKFLQFFRLLILLKGVIQIPCLHDLISTMYLF